MAFDYTRGKILVLGSARLFFGMASTVVPSETRADTFHGYVCLDDCSGHEAGYAWAEQNDITDPDDCDGNSQSFIEGCQAWAEEYKEETPDHEQEDESGEPTEE